MESYNSKENLYSAFSFAICYLLSAFMLLATSSCSTPTANPKGSLTGVVFLDGQDDHSGITVALYNLAELDPDIVYANETWPHIGVIINQHTEFDHRFQSPIAVTQTEADGSFELTKIPIGTYNLVAIKDGWGFKYLYEVVIIKGENNLSELTPRSPLSNKEGKIVRHSEELSQRNLTKNEQPATRSSVILSDPENRDCIEGQAQNSQLKTQNSTRNSDITLYAEEVISGYFPDQSNHFLTDHHYIIEDDTQLLPTQYLEIQPGAVIRIKPGVDLTIHGMLKAQGQENNMFWVTSNEGFIQQQVISIQQLDEVELYNSMDLSNLANVTDDIIEWGKWSWGNQCLIIRADNVFVLYDIFTNCNNGIYNDNTMYNILENITAVNCLGQSDAGIYIKSSSNNVFYGEINKNIIVNCYQGINIESYCLPTIQHNFIYNTHVSIHVSSYSSPIIRYNELDNANQGIYLDYQSAATICYNIINSKVCIETYKTVNNEIIANNNNFYSDSYAFKIGRRCYYDINGLNNFFNTVEQNEIENLIFDKNDVNIEEQQYYCYVNFLPFLLNESIYAGIQEDK
jgi:hypothetical protein